MPLLVELPCRTSLYWYALSVRVLSHSTTFLSLVMFSVWILHSFQLTPKPRLSLSLSHATPPSLSLFIPFFRFDVRILKIM